MVFAHFTTIAHRLKTADDWRNDEAMAGGDAFFEEGIHWLHVAGSLGPRIVSAHGYRPPASRTGPDRRAKSMMVAFRYDNDAVGALYYSREVPSLLPRACGSRSSSAGEGVITFESNGAFVVARGAAAAVGCSSRAFATSAATGRCTATSSAAIRAGRAPEMSLERAIEDQRLMDQIYASVAATELAAPPTVGAPDR